MAFKQSVVLLLLVAGATVTNAVYTLYSPIANVSDPKIQTLGSMAVENYNKRVESHILFKEVWGGESAPLYYPWGGFHVRNYFLYLTAIKCSQSGALRNYTAEVLEDEQHGVFTYTFGQFNVWG